MKSITLLLLTCLISLYTIQTSFGQSSVSSENQKDIIYETQVGFLDLTETRTKANRNENREELKEALKATFLNVGTKGFSLIVEGGSLNSFNYHLPSANPEAQTMFISKTDGWTNLGGFMAGMKIAKTINDNAFDSKLSIDLITGLMYKNANTHQRKEADLNIFSDPRIFFCGVGHDSPAIRDIHSHIIELPIEIRSNIKINRLVLSPTFGLSLNKTIKNNITSYSYEYIDNQLVQGAENYTSSFEGGIHASLISKMEVGYLFNNNHRLKISGYYSLLLGNHRQSYYGNNSNVSAEGILIGYEIPMALSKRKIKV